VFALTDEQKLRDMVTIIVPTLNSEKTIKACINSLVQQKYPHEIIVIDGGSVDNTLSLLPSDIKVLVVPGNQAVAMNAGIRLARGSLIAFIDSDCVAPPEWLETMVNVLKKEKVAAVASGNMINPNDSLISKLTWRVMGSMLGCGGTTHARIFDYPRPLKHAVSYNALYVKNVLLELGGFDEELGGAEDVEMGKRLRDHGYRIVYAPGAEVWHKGKDSLYGFWRQMRGFGWSKGRLIKKDISNLQLVHLLPFIMTPIIFLLSFLFPLTLFFILLLLLIYGIKFTLQEHNIMALPLTPVIFTILVIGWSFGFMESLWRGANPKDKIGRKK
jgi:GT2 family glycosyltransferase